MSSAKLNKRHFRIICMGRKYSGFVDLASLAAKAFYDLQLGQTADMNPVNDLAAVLDIEDHSRLIPLLRDVLNQVYPLGHSYSADLDLLVGVIDVSEKLNACAKQQKYDPDLATFCSLLYKKASYFDLRTLDSFVMELGSASQ